MNNKEALEKIKAFLLTQDPETVADVLAGHMIDVNRLANLKDLPEDERKNLWNRIHLNAQEIRRRIREGFTSNLKSEVRNP